AAFLILLFDSNQLFTSGFQLSFAVVGAIILLADPMFVRFERIVAPDPFLPPPLLSRMQRIYAAMGRGLARSLDWIVGAYLLVFLSHNADIAPSQSRGGTDRLFCSRARHVVADRCAA